MILPTRRAVAVLAAGLPLALLPSLVSPDLWWLWAAAFGTSLAALLTEWLAGMPPGRLTVAAHPPGLLYIGERQVLKLEVRCAWPWPVGLDVVCDLDELLVAQDALSMRGRPAATTAEVALVPVRRGTAAVRAVWLRWRGPLGLLQWTARRPLNVEIPVVPNVRAVRGAALRFFSARQFLSGLKRERYLGDGSEFESLRDHVPGLDARALDWKASARHRKLLSREFRAERNHAVVVALDTGRLMSEPMAGVPKLDHAINAALLLAYVALKTGDRVGLFAFDETVRLFSEPQGGVPSFGRLQHQTASVEYSHAETNFTSSLVELGQRLHRRSLVVVMTDFVDTIAAELMIENLARLGRSHLVMFVALRDVGLDALLQAPPSGLRDLHRAVSAHDLVRERDVVLGRLRRQGIHCVDAAPAEVSTRLINSYLDAKRREMI